jgi:hypothetical protein
LCLQDFALDNFSSPALDLVPDLCDVVAQIGRKPESYGAFVTGWVFLASVVHSHRLLRITTKQIPLGFRDRVVAIMKALHLTCSQFGFFGAAEDSTGCEMK